MNRTRRLIAVAIVTSLSLFPLSTTAHASTAYGTLNNFDCVNDTGVEAHGFEIELVDVHSTDITYTYDYNHYGIPKITEDTTDPAHPKVFIRWAAARNPDGTWTAFTAIPSGSIAPTDGHQFTNPSVNFGGEHFGVGYYGVPAAVKYNWLIGDGAGSLVHGPPVYVATPTFTYYPPVVLPVPQVQAVIVPPPPPDPPVLQFGDAVWVKDIKTTTHNAGKVALRDLVDPDPENPAARNWANGEPTEVETEWRILQTEFANAANPNGQLAGVAQDLAEGNEIVTRRYEFYKYVGPIDAESGQAMADAVGPDGIHGVGSVTYNDHIDPSGEWVTATVDLSTMTVVGEFFGAQMSGFDVAPALGLIDHIPDGELNVPYAPRTVVVAGGAAFLASSSGLLPTGTAFDAVTGIFSGTPTAAGSFTFAIDVSDTSGAALSKTYTVTIPGDAHATSTIATSASPVAGGSTAGGGSFVNGTPVTVVATHGPGYAFVNWTEGGLEASPSGVYPFTVNGDRTLVANFARVTHSIATSASPFTGGGTSGGGTVYWGDSVTVVATANQGYRFVGWSEGGAVVSSTPSYTFTATADRSLVANFVVTYAVGTSAMPADGGSTSGGGTVDGGANVTVVATANPAFRFVNWTEGGAVVSASASYSFTASGNRVLVANFAPKTPIIEIDQAAATRSGSKIDVTVVIRNNGDAAAGGVTLPTKKNATIDGKFMNERVPINLGDIPPGGSATMVLTFSGVKTGTRNLQVIMEYAGGTAIRTAVVSIP
jgi:hypothetical protein